MSERDVRALPGGDARLVDEDVEELYEEAPCGFLSTSPDGEILRANRTFLELSGYGADELAGRRFYDLLPPGAKIYYETHYAPLLQLQGHARELALEVVRSDGRRVPVLVSAVLKRDDEGRPLLVRLTVFDASDRRRYERELLHARSEAEARAAAATALEHVTDGVVLVDDDGRVLLLNPAAEMLLDASQEVARGLPLTALAPGWAPPEPHAAPEVVPLLSADGTRWVVVTARTAPEGVVFTLRDVTEERRLEQLRDDVVAIVSHELRTPLAGVYGAAQTLASLGDRLSEEERRRLVEMIGEQSERLTQIVDRILLARRVGDAEFVIARRAFDLGRAVREIVAGARGRVVLDAPDGVEVEGDPDLLANVVTSLLENALVYGGDAVRVTVSVEAGAGRVVVADDGPGIPPGERERVFEKFFRLDPDQRGGTSGIGLGLYVARELVRRMDGRLGLLESERGASFHVDLPLRRAS